MGTFILSDSARLSPRGDARPGREVPAILVLDPDWDSRQILRTLLAANGYRVLVAGTVEEAREHALRHRVVLVITESRDELGEISLPASVRDDLLLADVPLIVHTSWVHPADKMAAIACGARAFIPKPYDHDSLVECVRETLQAATDAGERRRVSGWRSRDTFDLWRGAGC